MYKFSCPIPGTKFFGQFETLSDDQAREALHESWTTQEQRKYNAEHATCPTCKGRGYKVHRTSGGQTIRENVGCQSCLGTGAVSKLWPARA
jgi:hypothetical protein